MEAKDSAIVAKDKIIESQKQHIAQLTINGMSAKEQDDLTVQIQNLTEERDVLLIANGNLVKQAKTYNQEKQALLMDKKAEIETVKNQMSDIAKNLENIEKELE